MIRDDREPGGNALPTGLAAPARRALLAAGYDTLDPLAQASDDELARLHGVGPKAIRQIRAARVDRHRQTGASRDG